MARSKHSEVCDRSVKATKMPKEQLKWKLKIRNVEQMAGSKHSEVCDRSVKAIAARVSARLTLHCNDAYCTAILQYNIAKQYRIAIGLLLSALLISLHCIMRIDSIWNGRELLVAFKLLFLCTCCKIKNCVFCLNKLLFWAKCDVQKVECGICNVHCYMCKAHYAIFSVWQLHQ